MQLAPRKILIATHNIVGNTGSSRIILANIMGLTQAGHTVWTISEKCDKELVSAAGARPITVPKIKIGRYARRYIFSKFVDIAAKVLQPDLVWGQGDNLTSDLLSLHNCVHLADELLNGTPIQKQGSVQKLHSKLLSEQNFTHVIANSNLMRNDLIQRYGVDSNKIRVIYPGYSPERFSLLHREKHRAEFRKQFRIADDKTVVGLITSGDFKKRGVKTLLQSVALVPEEYRKKLVVAIVGKEKNKELYMAEAGKLGLSDQVIFHPAVPDVHKLYHGLDLMVHAGPIEEFGLIVLEAVVCGTPVLASRGVGAMELAVKSSSEFTIPLKPDPDIFAAEIEKFVREPEYAARWLELYRPAFLAHTEEAHFKATMDFFAESKMLA